MQASAVSVLGLTTTATTYLRFTSSLHLCSQTLVNPLRSCCQPSQTTGSWSSITSWQHVLSQIYSLTRPKKYPRLPNHASQKASLCHCQSMMLLPSPSPILSQVVPGISSEKSGSETLNFWGISSPSQNELVTSIFRGYVVHWVHSEGAQNFRADICASRLPDVLSDYSSASHK